MISDRSFWVGLKMSASRNFKTQEREKKAAAILKEYDDIQINIAESKTLINASPLKSILKKSPLEESDEEKVPFTARTSPPVLRTMKSGRKIVVKKSPNSPIEKSQTWEEAAQAFKDNEDEDEEDDVVDADGYELTKAKVVKPDKSGTFRFKGMKALLTYRTHLDKDGMRDFMEEIALRNNLILNEFFICHENGDSTTAYEHSHVWFKMDTTLLFRSANYLDVPENPDDEDSPMIHPHIQTFGIALADEWRAKYYLTKEDESEDLKELRTLCINAAREKKFRLGGGKSGDIIEVSIAEQVWACNSVAEVLKLCTKPADAIGLMAIYQEKQQKAKVPKPIRGNLEFTWQLHYLKELKSDNWNPRGFNWIVGPEGADGKSTFAKWFIHNYGGVYLSNACKINDIATILETHYKQGGSFKYIFLDLPRAAEYHKIWEAVECIVTGRINVGKYKSTQLSLDDMCQPRLTVFSNFKPPYYVDKKGKFLDEDGCITDKPLTTVSKDRWRIGNITSVLDKNGDDDKIVTWVPNFWYGKWKPSTRFDHLGDEY